MYTACRKYSYSYLSEHYYCNIELKWLPVSLRSQGVEYLFGIIGIPIVEVAYSAQAAGVKYESLLISMYKLIIIFIFTTYTL